MSFESTKNFDLVFYTPISGSSRGSKLCQLSNGMLVFLISDPSDTVGSCSVSVATGSHNDPDEALGLAHLCEHAILSGGSKKYPGANYYHEVLAQNGGSHNAYTTGETTTFYFELPAISDSGELHFDKALDVLASSLKAPLFSDILINKEIYAIESEHNINKALVGKQLYHASRLLANPSHPFSRFCTGNFTTLCTLPSLNKFNIKAALTSFHKRYYKASNMSLCLRGSQSLNTLTKLAIRFFGDLPASGQTISRPSSSSLFSNKDTAQSVPFFKILKNEWAPKYKDVRAFSQGSPNVVAIQSSKCPVLRLIFPVSHKSTRLSSSDITTFSSTWCDFFGDESVGSLADCLKGCGLISGIVSSVSHFATEEDGLTLELTLTKHGWKNIPTIMCILFDDYIPKLIHDKTEDIARCLSELNAIELLKFLYQSTEKSPMDMCANLSAYLLLDLETLDPKCLLKGSPLIECNQEHSRIGDYSENTESQTWWIGRAIKFQNLVSEFVNRQNLRAVMLGDQSKSNFLASVRSTTKTDAYYEFDYRIAYVDMLSIQLDDYTAPNYHFHVPSYDTFLPMVARKLSLIKQALQVSSTRAQSASLHLIPRSDFLQTPPRLAGKNSNYEVWVKEEELDLSFSSKSIVSFEIISKSVCASPKNTMYLEILGQLLAGTLSATLYPSEKLGYTYEISPSSKGDVRLGLTVSGFPEGVYNLIKIIVEEIKSLSSRDIISSKVFREARIAVRSKYEEAAAANCTALASLGLLIVLEECMWPIEDRLEALEEISQETFTMFCSHFLTSPTYMNLFIQGDMSCMEKINSFLNWSLTSHLDDTREYQGPVREPGAKILEAGTNIFVKRNAFTDDPNNSIVYFIQTGEREDSRAYTYTCLAEFFLSLTLVPDLRNKKQIGYAVFGGLRLLSTSIGLHITCMSNSPPEHLEVQIEEYLSYLEKGLLDTMTEEEFQEHYIRKYRVMVENNQVNRMQKTAGPADLMGQIEANVRSGNLEEQGSAMRLHKNTKNQISNRRYNFGMEEEPVNRDILRTITLSEFRSFFSEKISIYSLKRSKLSVMIASPMTAEEISQKRLFLQVESFLKLKGLKIPSSDLHDIIETSLGRTSGILRGLFRYFSANGETMKLCNVIIKEISKALVLSLKNPSQRTRVDDALRGLSKNVTSALPLTEIKDVNQFRSLNEVTYMERHTA